MTISISPIRFREIAEKTISKLLELDREEAMEFFREELDLEEYEREFFEVPTEENYWSYDDDVSFEDDSDRGCSECPDDECTGHCMSCYYRPV